MLNTYIASGGRRKLLNNSKNHHFEIYNDKQPIGTIVNTIKLVYDCLCAQSPAGSTKEKESCLFQSIGFLVTQLIPRETQA